MAARLTTYVVVAIVAATLIAGLIVGAQRDDNSGPVDLIVHNAKVYTADARGTMAEAIAIRGNKILHVGSEREVMRYRRPQTIVIDANGAAVVPGFNDAHVSLVDTGLALEGVDVSGTSSVDDVRVRVADWAHGHPDAAWITGRGWTFAGLAESLSVPLTRADLDLKDDARPVVLLSGDGHAAWVNTSALRAARITKRTPPPAGGEIDRDRRGEPTGILKGSAVALVTSQQPRASREDRARALRRALLNAHERGITSVQDFSSTAGDLDLFDEARRDEDLDVRVYAAVPVTTASAGALDDLLERFPDDPLLKTGLAEIEAGASPAVLREIVGSVDAREWQVAADVRTAADVATALDAFSYAVTANAGRSADRRHRLEGMSVVPDEALPRLKRAHWVATFEPLYMTAEGAARSVPDLSLLRWPLRTLEKMGVAMAFGSGAPDRPMDPLAAIAAILEGGPEGPDEALRIKSAISGWTSGAAWAEFDEHRKGMIQAGMLADVVILSSDILTDPAASLSTAVVDTTIFDGKVVYHRKGTT